MTLFYRTVFDHLSLADVGHAPRYMPRTVAFSHED